MTDLFALLGETPRPWLDPDALKTKYHRLTTEQHPDVAGATADFAEINRAYQTLSDPVLRLRHLLDLESAPLSRTQPVPDDIAAFFAPVAEARQAFDVFLKKYAAATSPLAKALLTTEQYAVQETLEETIAVLQEKQETLMAALRDADAHWEADHAAVLATLPIIWQSLGYLAKWLATLREALFRMAAL
jgi:curved DNA-binding protein CbpA